MSDTSVLLGLYALNYQVGIGQHFFVTEFVTGMWKSVELMWVIGNR
jgi:hypothetical protein